MTHERPGGQEIPLVRDYVGSVATEVWALRRSSVFCGQGWLPDGPAWLVIVCVHIMWWTDLFEADHHFTREFHVFEHPLQFTGEVRPTFCTHSIYTHFWNGDIVSGNM